MPEATTTSTPHKITFRGTDSRTTTQWADAISEQLTQRSDTITSSKVTIPSHARIRRTRPTTANVVDNYVDSHANRDSSMISAAALASRRKRLDSLGRTLETSSASQLPRDPDSISKATTVRPFTAADKFIKASRRVSVEVFASALGNRKSTDAESVNQSRPTTSSGASMRSSICCPGLDSNRISIENKPSMTTTPNYTSFATFSSPFVSTIRRSSSRRRQSTSSNSTNRSSVHFDLTTLASLAQTSSIRPSSILTSSASAFDISFSSSSGGESMPKERSSSSMIRSTSYSPALFNPLTAQSIELARVNEDRSMMLMPKSLSTAFGLNLYEEQRATFRAPIRSNLEPLPAYSQSIAHAIIVESPTSEDLATLLANGNSTVQSQKVNLSVQATATVGTGKLALSASMPALHQTFSKGNEDDAASRTLSGMTTSPSFRFASLGKLSGRKNGLLGFKRAPSPKIATNTSTTASSPGLGPLSRRPATSTGLRTVVSSPQLDDDHQRDSENASIAPFVERILPPQEIIATIDRLKKQHSASSLPSASRSTMTLSDYASPNRRNVILPDWRDVKGEVYRPRPTRPIRPELQNRSSSPRLRDVASTLTSSHTFNELPSLSNRPKEYHYQRMNTDNNAGLVGLSRLEEHRAQSPSLPVPPRNNRRIINDLHHQRMSSREDKENVNLSRLIMENKENRSSTKMLAMKMNQNVAAIRGGNQERPKRPLRSSISENFSLRAMAQV